VSAIGSQVAQPPQNPAGIEQQADESVIVHQRILDVVWRALEIGAITIGPKRVPTPGFAAP
jgi:hypothetical protein